MNDLYNRGNWFYRRKGDNMQLNRHIGYIDRVIVTKTNTHRERWNVYLLTVGRIDGTG